MTTQSHAIVRNRDHVVATFPSRTLAEEAFYDLGCYAPERPRPEDVFEVRCPDGSFFVPGEKES